MKRFVITEDEKKHIKQLYNINEIDKEAVKQSVINYMKDVISGKVKPEITTSDDSDKTTDEPISTEPIKDLNDIEQIVFKELKEDGYTDEATAAVMGVVAGESGFKMFKEPSYKNTSNYRIRSIFPSKLGKLSDSQLNKLKQSDEDFFNAVYGGMFGNKANEGWKYVGRGFNGITFKSNYEKAQECTGIPFVNSPELMEDPSNAAKALSCYFKKVKDISDFNNAFQEAYRENAGPGKSWEYYATSDNPVHKQGTSLKKSKAQQYYDKIKSNIT